MTQSSNPQAFSDQAQPHQDRRDARGRHCGTGVSSRRLGLRGLSGAPDQDCGRQYAGRALRHHRPHHGGGHDGHDRRIGDRGEQGRRRRQYRHGPGRARPSPDGYTILLSTSAFSVNPGLYQNPVYDPFKDFVAVCELAVSPHVFAVKPDLGVNTMKEFVALAKKDPDKFNVSTPPIGTTPQLQAEVLKQREGLQGMAT